jgi:hypothetical protein
MQVLKLMSDFTTYSRNRHYSGLYWNYCRIHNRHCCHFRYCNHNRLQWIAEEEVQYSMDSLLQSD